MGIDEDCGASVNEWVNVVRRARIGTTAYTVALTLASYAKPDGTKVYPGVARLAVQCEISYTVARRALATLRDAGLIEVTKPGNRRTGRADEYRLILAPDVLERIDVPTPAAEQKAIAELNDRNAAASQKRQERKKLRDASTLSQESVEDAVSTLSQVSVDTDSSTLTQAGVENGDLRPDDASIYALPGERPTSIRTLPEPPAEPPPVDPFGFQREPPTREADPEAERQRQLAELEASPFWPEPAEPNGKHDASGPVEKPDTLPEPDAAAWPALMADEPPEDLDELEEIYAEDDR